MTGSVFIDVLRQHAAQKSTGLLRVNARGEALVYLGVGHPVHAAYQQRKGIEVLHEIVTWNDAKIQFEGFHFAQERTINGEAETLIHALEQVARQKQAIGMLSSEDIYYYSLPVPFDDTRSALAQQLIANADGLKLEELVAQTRSDPQIVIQTLQHLIDQGAIRSETSEATPNRLRGIRPRYAPPPKMALFSRPRVITLSDKDQTFYDAIDGRRSLWEIRINLDWPRQDVWDAYGRLRELKVIVDAQ